MVATLALALALATAPAEARISIDVRDADIVDVVRLLAEVGSLQVVFDPGTACKLTLALHEVPWDRVLDVSLRSCGLAQESDGGVVRIASASRLLEEAAQHRKLADEQRLNRPLQTTRYRLSYARAAELGPLLKRFLSPRGDVVWDARTNTLLITDIAP